MPSYLRKNGGEILNEALKKLQRDTPITSISRGSIARALTESITTELGDLYEIMDYNLNQNLLSTASGTALDLIGKLYNVERKTINNLEAIDKQMGAFIFYLRTPAITNITIPKGTNVYTNATSYVGQKFSYSTTDDVTIPAGRTRAYVSLKPNFNDSVFTAGPNTLTLHDYPSTPSTIVYCTNPKEISQQLTFEADDAFRTRIIKSIRVNSGGTVEAMRFAILGVSGVRDVSIRQAPYGMGSFEVIITPEQNGNAGQIISSATGIAEAARPLGSRLFVKTPKTKVVDMTVSLIIPGSGSTQFADTAIKRATVGITRYINSLLPGNALVYNKLVSIIIDSSDFVKDIVMNNFKVDSVEVLRRNFQPGDDEQLISGNIIVKIATS